MKHIESFYGEDDFAEAAAPTDSDIAAQVRGGNNEAFAELWRHVAPGVRTVAYKNGTVYQDLDDAVQDVAVKLLEVTQGRTPDFKNGAHSYANGIAKNQAIDRWRRRNFRGEVLHDKLGAIAPRAAYTSGELPETI